MSRVGKNPVNVPSGVEFNLTEALVSVKGKNGNLSMPLSKEVIVKAEGTQIFVQPRSNSKQSRMMWGTTKKLIENLVVGVHTGFTKVLEINGVGYRAAIQGNKLQLNLGFSHDLDVEIPSDLTVKCDKPTQITISGADRQRVGQFAAVIRSYKKPEPYKGKGIKYQDEVILRKEGKKK